MQAFFEDESTEAVILVSANNAFNALNRPTTTTTTTTTTTVFILHLYASFSAVLLEFRLRS